MENPIAMAIVIIYLIISLLLSYFARAQTKTQDEFYVAGGQSVLGRKRFGPAG